MSTLKVNTIDSHSGSTLTFDSTADILVASSTSSTSNTTGALKVTGGISTQENLYVGGNAVITGTMTANGGTITLGDAGTDNVTIGGEINSDVIPDATNTYDLGSSSKKWAEVHATTLTGNLTGNASGSAGSCTGNSATATALETARTIGLSGDVSGSVSFDGTANATITATIADDSHNHTTANVDGLDTALGLKAPLASPALTGTPTAPTASANTDTTQVATTAFVQTEITDLIGGAPGALDTLNELAAAINDDSSYASTITTNLGTKVDKVTGKALSKNDFTDALKSKLDAIEAGATADQTSEEIQDIVGGMVTGNTESGVTVTYQDADGTLDFSVASQTDENFTTADHSKLDGIESGATADQSNAEIKTAYEANSNTNAFTDADHSKLDGIESGATANQTNEEIQDIVGGMVTGNTESGLAVTYQDADGTLDFSITADPTITLGGDLSGSATLTNLGSATLTATIADDSHNHVISNVDGLQTALDAKTTESYVDSEITSLIGGAPGTLNTLNELAAAINDDASYASTLTTSLATKTAKTSSQSLSSAANAMTISGHTITLNRGDGSTDTVTVPDNNTTYSVGDNGLTQKNFTSTLKSKLDGIATNANNYSYPYSVNQSTATSSNVTFNNVTVAGSLTESSAAIYKENISPLQDQLANVMKLNPVEYDKKSNGVHEYGLIAGEVQKVYPDFVATKDGVADSLNYSRMVSVLVKAVQELTAKVEGLTKK